MRALLCGYTELVNVYNFHITEIVDYCIPEEDDDWYSNDYKGDYVAQGYCKVYHIAPVPFEIIFPIYFALDLIKFVGDEIRIRVLVLSILAATQSFLMFLVWNYVLDELLESEEDDTEEYSPLPPTNVITEYAFSWATGSNFILFFLSLVLMIMVIWKRNSDNDASTRNSVLMKIIGFLMLISLGGSLKLIPVFIYSWGSIYLDEWIELIVPAVILLVYEIQYL